MATMTGRERWGQCGAKYLPDTGSITHRFKKSTNCRDQKRAQRFPMKASASAIPTSYRRLSTRASHARAHANAIRIDRVKTWT